MKKALSILLVLATILLSPCNAYAITEVQKPHNKRYYRIKYSQNNRYLDIPSERFGTDGTQLQLWDYTEGNQNQIFQLIKDGKYWIIQSTNDKVIEVRDSRHDDRAPVAQWTKHDLKCARWKIVKNSDGTVSFKNVESNKYLNVSGGGDAGNGTKIIQYHNDHTNAMRFYLEELNDSDLYFATYKLSQNKIQDQIQWMDITDPLHPGNVLTNFKNKTEFEKRENGVTYFPQSQRILVSIDFLSSLEVQNITYNHTIEPPLWDQISDVAKGQAKSDSVDYVVDRLTNTGLMPKFVGKLFPFVVDVCLVLVGLNTADTWNRFQSTAKPDRKVPYQGIIVYHYKVIRSENGPNAREISINQYDEVAFDTWWNGSAIDELHIPFLDSGDWYYYYK